MNSNIDRATSDKVSIKYPEMIPKASLTESRHSKIKPEETQLKKEKFHYEETISARGNTPCVIFRKEVLNWFIGKVKDDAIGTPLKLYPTMIDGEKVLIIKEGASDEQDTK